jgi:HD-GYP domain-containing protein (c-di-GMP phosphodiesterase class II)
MGEYLGLPDQLVRDIEVFGPLHDVGKIGINDSVLLKPSPLSKDERDICREHCIIGERIIRPLRPSPAALGMVRNHHESWNGRGYPDGLEGEDVPRLARLLHVADAYDAMVSDRPYQAAMSEQEVLAHFKLYAGDRYDPVAVEALAAVVKEGLAHHATDHDSFAGGDVPSEVHEALSVSSRDE